MSLAGVRIVLVEPAGPLNVGSIARVMKNMGLRQLVLVNPHCDPRGEEARLMAVHAADILEAAQPVESLPEALQGCHRAIATTGRTHTPEVILESPRRALPWLLEFPAPDRQSALIFGPEDRGLSNAELKYAQRLIQIPSHPDYPSLNLAQAVAICCYELYQLTLETSDISPQWAPIPTAALSTADPPAALDALEGYYQHLESLLLQIEYLYPHTAASRMTKFRRLLNRAGPSAGEVALLRGVLRQMQWAIDQNASK